MIVKRNEHNDEEVIELENGCRFHYLYNFDSLDNMKEKLEEARTAFKNNPSQINRLDMIYQAADYMWAKGEHQEATEYLKQEIDGTGEVVGAPENLLKWMDCYSLLAELLLRMNRLEEALEYANVVMEIAENHFFDTLEYAYAEELYATVQAVLGNFDEAKAFYQDSLRRFKAETNEAQKMMDNIQLNLDSIDGKE